ncbi:MAG: hypothetical protein NNA21_08060 [Nitrospira sp.]|nr:hypothetical protein [Nitrospira sp.]MCP9462190.1 hypothetical protein [Nitrospira sp.]MCP9471453.1 hypothetical protein [Nitrospira sp.]MCP9474954.1 hypothetical protein [Nitrospira sp.]
MGYGKIFPLADRYNFRNHFLFDDAVDDSDGLWDRIEFVIVRAVWLFLTTATRLRRLPLRSANTRPKERATFDALSISSFL